MPARDLARDVGARRLRRAAFTLARMAPVDRDWILGQLSPAERAKLSHAVGGANGFGQLVQVGPQVAQAETLPNGPTQSPVDCARGPAVLALVRLLASIGQSPSAEWLVPALAQTLAPADLAQAQHALPRSLRKRLSVAAPSARLTHLAARALADAADEAGASLPTQLPERASTGRPLARWFKLGRR